MFRVSIDMDSDWSQIVPELLHLILLRLPLPDCFNFGKVCRSWRSVFLEKRSLSRPPPFIVRIPDGPGTLARQPLWSLHGGKFIKLRSPRPGFLLSECIIGSSMGWLVIGSARHSGLQLLNPTSNERIPLPLVSTDENQIQSNFGYTYFTCLHVILSSSPTSGDCLIVATGYRRGHDFLALCRPGDQEWTTYANQSLPPGFSVRNIAFYKGELFVLGEKGDIVVYAFDSKPRMTHTGSIVSICGNKLKQRLVESGGDLFLVVWHSHDMLEVFKQVGGWDGEWVRVESLSDRVLLIGNHTLESFCVQDLMGSGFEANCVYYYSVGLLSKDLVKFSLADRSSERIPIDTCFEWISAQAW